MNKEKIVRELDKYVNTIDSCFNVDDKDDDLNLRIGDSLVFYFCKFNINRPYFVSCTNRESLALIKFNIIKKFYDKVVELLKKNEELYTVQAIKNDTCSFLNYCYEVSKYIFGDKQNGEGYKTRFAKSEIEALKQRDDIAIDWDKAIIKEVK